jgi:hypothetical protein
MADRPISIIADFLTPKDRNSLASSGDRTLRETNALLPSALEIRILDSETIDSVRLMLPSLVRFEKIRIGFNLGHLEILRGCTSLRHLIVQGNREEDSTIQPFIDALSDFVNLTSLSIDDVNGYGSGPQVNIAQLQSLAKLTKFEISGVTLRIPIHESIQSVRQMLPSIGRFESIRIGFNL